MVDPGAPDGAGHAALLGVLEEARELGLLGPGPVERQYRHAADLALMLAPFDGRFLDLGSGGGVPGLVVAHALRDSSGVLLDSQRRRCDFLRRSVEALGFSGRLEIACGRAEVLARETTLRGNFDLVVARSFGPPAVTAECAVGFLRAGGTLVVTEPPGADEASGERWPASGMTSLGFVGMETSRRGDTSIMRATLADGVDDRWPRREGVPVKRPLW
jgi:16S rRNA (guanine527-N7)-methyltransferase